ncbi:hypothetical protein GCM10029964_022230 [Kibdelosporangium lantanae]
MAGLLSGRTRLPDELDAEAQRLIGGYGTDMAARLGFDREPTDAEVRSAIYDALGRWREQSESPLLGSAERDAARVVVRSCEAMLTPS